MKIFLIVIDGITLRVWLFLKGFGRLLVIGWNVLAMLARRSWSWLAEFETFTGIIDKLENAGEICLGIWELPVLEVLRRSIRDLRARIRLKLDESPASRRWLFALLILLLLLFIYPPSAWGPWYHYQRGVASWYGPGFLYRKTASGQRFLPFRYTAAHRNLPLGITVKVRNRNNDRCLIVRINDRGPYVGGRIIDLSPAAARKLGIKEKGLAEVDIFTRKKYRKKKK